jgi:hypothetical protein
MESLLKNAPWRKAHRQRAASMPTVENSEAHGFGPALGDVARTLRSHGNQNRPDAIHPKSITNPLRTDGRFANAIRILEARRF